MQTPACGDNYISYTIAKGQTLYAIARQFNTTVAEILAANPALDVQLYYAGDVICIPKPDSGTSCANGTPYTIRQGDSFYLIAQRFGIRWPICWPPTPAWTPRGWSSARSSASRSRPRRAVPTDTAYIPSPRGRPSWICRCSTTFPTTRCAVPIRTLI